MEKYRVGIIGCGLMGTNHAVAYRANPKTEIVAAADPDEENLSIFCERFNIPEHSRYSSYEELLEKEKIDVAGIILPVKVNPSAVLAATEADVKAIFCEKPISASLEDADRMVEACRSRGITFACGAAFRGIPQYWEARKMIETGEIGDITSINSYSNITEISGGGCQDLNLIRLFASDREVSWVVGWVYGDPWSDEDQGEGGYLHLEDDIECFIHGHTAIKNGIEVIGFRGILYLEGNETFHLWKAPDSIENPTSRDLQKVPFPYPFRLYWRIDNRRPESRLADCIQGLLDAMEKGISPPCSGDDMRKVLEIAIALRQSHREGHKPVKLPLEDRTLKIIPKPSRWLSKKAVDGKCWYTEQLKKYGC